MPEHRPKTVFLLAPANPAFEYIFQCVSEAALTVGAEAIQIRGVFSPEKPSELLDVVLAGADVIVCDLSFEDPDVLYQLGFARASAKPLILLTQRLEHLPLDLRGFPVFRYSRSPKDRSRFITSLAGVLKNGLRHPAEFLRQASLPGKRRVFISYSHEDSPHLERLLVHLRPLERAGRVQLFVDTRLKPGDRWQREIETALNEATAAILLVSADFLASEFIVNNELPPLLDHAESQGTLILPLILKPCRFDRDPALKKFQAFNDPARPLVALNECERESVLDRVAQRVEELTPLL